MSEGKTNVENLVFGLIEQAAVAGARCPQNDEIWQAIADAGLPFSWQPSEIIAALAKQGRVTGGISAHNWRRLWIRSGPHTGKSTKAAAFKTRMYVIYDRFGVSRANRVGKEHGGNVGTVET